MIRIVIADDEELIRGALVALLGLEPDLEVVADVADGAAAVAGARTHRPDVVLLDLEMPVLDGIEAARALSDAMPTVIVTRHARPGTLRRALSAGVRGFVPKSTPAARLAEIIRDVAAGERYIDAGLAAAALTEDESPLTPREADVLRCTRDGLATKQIARELSLAHGTVRNHLSSAIAKLHVDNRVAAAAVAWDRGWI
ncbi:response regulator transcription factor [Curtobacterium sp. MCLR17_034]|uniref:response regulator transcription factor n=1 Tax=Curtobacterium sp. MCLR17_034 TaxID=2175623 RepID=UPI000DAA7E9D|nr:response regulator transcription factor [Curtobacterium sp. MCLR17_034]PZF13163.1 DNA-binding response regulator [Curtobacterium sp. MCLR17_034]